MRETTPRDTDVKGGLVHEQRDSIRELIWPKYISAMDPLQQGSYNATVKRKELAPGPNASSVEIAYRKRLVPFVGPFYWAPIRLYEDDRSIRVHT